MRSNSVVRTDTGRAVDRAAGQLIFKGVKHIIKGQMVQE